MADIIGAAIALTLVVTITTMLLVTDRQRKKLPEDDGIVWNTTIEKRMEESR